MLNGFDRNGQQVINQANFFLQEGLGVSNAAEHAVKAGHGVDTRADFSMSGKQILARLLIAELRLIREDGGEFLLELVADIDDERRPHIVIKRSVDNFE